MSRSHEGRALTDTHSPEMHIENQATIQASPHEDAGKSADHAEGRDDTGRMCHHANKVHKGQSLALRKLLVLSTETEVVEMLVALEHNIVVLCCSFAVASDLGPSPSQGMNSAVADAALICIQTHHSSTTAIAGCIAAVAGAVEMSFCCHMV